MRNVRGMGLLHIRYNLRSTDPAGLSSNPPDEGGDGPAAGYLFLVSSEGYHLTTSDNYVLTVSEV